MKKLIVGTLFLMGTWCMANCPDTVEQIEALSFDQYLENMRTDGWNVQVSRNTVGSIIVELTKEGLDEETHGLFNIEWKSKTIWKFVYAQLDDNILVIADAEGKGFLKSPLGKWRVMEEYDSIPSSILQRRLGYCST